MAIITLNNNSLSSVTALPAGVGGKVLQVVTSVPTSSFLTTSTTLVDTNYSITITPTATNSKMIVEFSGNFASDPQGRNQIQVQTNSSGSYAAIKTASYVAWNNSSGSGSMDIVRVIEDSVGTTNAVTYKMKARIISSGQTFYIPINANDASLCTVYEIAG
jgi:hypothetical protein